MSTFFPKRAKDLPPLEPESEDDKTPAKWTERREQNNQTVFGAMKLPRRASELPPLELDSEDDEENRLNCAILNDSFILSPYDPTPGKILKENDRNIPNQEKITENSFTLIHNMNKLAINDNTDDSLLPKKSNISNFRRTLLPKLEAVKDTDCSSILESEEIQRINEVENDVNKELSDILKNVDKLDVLMKNTSTIKTSPKLVSSQSSTAATGVTVITEDCCKNIENIKKSPILEIIEASEMVLETPCKINEENFITPQVKSFQMPSIRRGRLLSSNKITKCRSALKNEFRSEKVLFRTPIAFSRPVGQLPNDSITLSFDETIPKENIAREKPSLPEIKEDVKSSEEIRNPSAILEKPKNDSNEKRVLINGKEYVLLKKIGSGGSSSVFLAKRTDNNFECALKIVDLKGDPAVVEGYLNETKLLEKLQGNINVVGLYEYEHLVKKSNLYMVMEKGDSDLHKILQSYKTDLPLFVLMNFWYQILESVNYIHQNGVIHSDLKPANFLMVKGRLKLIDFGIASNISIDSTSIIKYTQAGTFNYISPEALIDTSTGNSPAVPKIKISKKSDVWSLGCILYLLTYKKTPFGHIKNGYAKVNAITNPKTEIEYPELPFYYPSMLTDMAKKCLQHNPKKRISVAELLKYPFDMVIPVKKDL